MAYKTIYTRRGAQLLVQASTTGQAIRLTEMAVGDGGGNPTTPTNTQTTLVRERYRAGINRIYQDPADNTRFTAELVIPATQGGWTMREIGVFDSNGTLIMIGALPEAYKPSPDEGAYSDVIVAVDFFLTTDAVINISFSPDTIVVNQTWLVNNWTAAQLIPGGTVGQVLGKESNNDGDYVWQDPSVANVTVDTVAETQLLAANQTTVDLALTTTYGLAVYIGAPGAGGTRIPRQTGADGWQPAPNNPTRVVLGKSYPAGYIFQGVNNEPAGSAPAPLERAKNLSDVLSIPTAQENLQVYSKGQVDGLGRQWAPPGAVMPFALNSAPVGWLKANGAAVSRIAYPELFAAIGTAFGAGDGFNTFNLPDLRGEFVRGWDDGRGLDAGRANRTTQGWAVESHSHTGTTNGGGQHQHTATTDVQGNHAHSISGSTNASGDHIHGAWTDAQGNHTHRSWTDAQGNHRHNIRYTGSQDGQSGGESLPANGRNAVETAGDYAMDYAGNHSHNVGMDAAGNHGHNIGMNGAGNHAHSVSGSTSAAGNHAHNLTTTWSGDHTHSFTTNNTGSGETRPRNVALLYCIKY